MQNRGPKLGLQGPVVSWQDPWAKEDSDSVMRTGTGAVVPSQDDRPEPKAYVNALKGLGAQFYVHHTFPGRDAEPAMLADLGEAGIDLVLGNEYGKGTTCPVRTPPFSPLEPPASPRQNRIRCR